MAQSKSVFIKVSVDSKKGQESLKQTRDSVDSLAAAEKRLKDLTTDKAKRLEVVNQKILQQKKANVDLARAELGLNKEQKKTAIQEAKSIVQKKQHREEVQRLVREIEKYNVKTKEQAAAASKASGSFSMLNFETKRSSGSFKNNRAQAGLNNAILIETGRVASDASFGMQGIANNISRLIELGQEYAGTGSGGLLGAFKQLGKSLFGVGGIIVGIQLLLSFLPKIIKRFEEIRERSDIVGATFKEVGENIASVAGNFDIYIGTLKSSSKTTEEKTEALKLLRKEFPDFIQDLVDSGASLKDFEENTDLVTSAIDRQREAIIDLAMARAAEQKMTEISSVIVQKRLDAELDKSKERDEFIEKSNRAIVKQELSTGEVILMSQEEKAQAYFDAVTEIDKAANEEIAIEQEKLDVLVEFTKLQSKAIKDGYGDRIGDLEDYYEIYLDKQKVFRKVLKEDLGKVTLEGLFQVEDPKEDDEFMRSLEKNLPQYIDDVEDYVSTQLLEEGKISLLKTAFKLEPKTREAELKQLKDRMSELGEPLIFETEEYRRAVQAINDKYDDIEAKSKRDHLKTMLGSISSFFKSASEIADGNKDLARASIIASAASASIGIWDSYFAKDKTATPAPFRLAGTIATQLALAASTVSALQSLNRNSISRSSSTGSSSRAAVTATAPQFNVVGTGATNQLAQAVGQQQQKPFKTYVTSKDVLESIGEYDRNQKTAGIG